MTAYMKETAMPWLAVPFDSPKVKELKQQFKVSGIPALIVVNGKGETVSKTARGEVANSGAAAFDEWAK